MFPSKYRLWNRPLLALLHFHILLATMPNPFAISSTASSTSEYRHKIIGADGIINDNLDPYKALGLIGPKASQSEIERAYKRLAIKWNPARNNNSTESWQRSTAADRAYQILSNPGRRKAYDQGHRHHQQQQQQHPWHREQQHQQRHQHSQQQHGNWLSQQPKKHQPAHFDNFVLPLASVIGTLLFIFAIGYLLNNQMNSSKRNSKRRRQQQKHCRPGSRNENSASNNEQELHADECQKTALTEEEKQQRMRARAWRAMGPLIHELRAETQFGLIRLLKPGCRSIIVLVDRESKDMLLQQFAQHVFGLRKNKTFSFGFLMVPKNLNWFRSLLELTMPDEEKRQEEDSPTNADSLSTASTGTTTTETKSSGGKQQEGTETAAVVCKSAEEKLPIRKDSKRLAAEKNRLQHINPKHTLGTVLVICGWKFYFSIYHPMHRPPSIRAKAIHPSEDIDGPEQEEVKLEETNEESDSPKRECATNLIRKRRSTLNKQPSAGLESSLHVENVLNGFPNFLRAMLEGTVRRYYVPEWPENFV